MPLYKTITIDEETKVLIWKIEESLPELSKEICLSEHCQARIGRMKSEIHRKGFMSIRHLLAEVGYVDKDLYYDDFGKPHLHDGKFISITHSNEFTGIIVSSREVGIDIEKRRDKILRIAHKFTPLEEYHTLANEDALVRKLTIVWCAKESLYKLYGKKGLLFLHHIYVADFDFDEGKTTARITFDGKSSQYEVHFLEFEEFTAAFAF
ncbi:MAG TPA: 4'-phosphopantetheinyl transferase superfamily protein [Flavobacteriaceae bacterium]|nr:4'-phosphopantetheinyl transferase superfamily protein [Flavobacteriaceae bacterium]